VSSWHCIRASEPVRLKSRQQEKVACHNRRSNLPRYLALIHDRDMKRDALSESPTRLALPAFWFQQCCQGGGGSDGARRFSRSREGYGGPRRIGSSRISPHRGVIDVEEAAEGGKPWDGRFLS
jgi:hypothetical protein